MRYADYEYERELSRMDTKQGLQSLFGGLGAVMMTMGVFFCCNPAMNLMHTGALCFAVGMAIAGEVILYMLGYPKVKKLAGSGITIFGLTMFIFGILYALYTTVHPLAGLWTMAVGEFILFYQMLPTKEKVEEIAENTAKKPAVHPNNKKKKKK